MYCQILPHDYVPRPPFHNTQIIYYISSSQSKISVMLTRYGHLNAIIGASLSNPHINSTAMHAIYGICIYVCMVRPSSARRFIDSVQSHMQSFVLKSLRSKTIATACSNLVHLCNISLVVSRLSEAMLSIKETRLQGATGSAIAWKIEDS